jgi:hypothetical protein
MRRLAYTDASRGYAILGVIAMYTAQYWPNISRT